MTNQSVQGSKSEENNESHVSWYSPRVSIFIGLFLLCLLSLPHTSWAAPDRAPEQQTITPPVLIISISGQGSVVSDAAPPYTLNQTVRLTAKADFGWRFVGWSGDLNSSDNPLKITLDVNKTVTATFIPQPASTIISDDFNECTLNTARWTYIDPVGDAEVTTTGEQVQVFIPSGVDHDIWIAGKRAPRFMQSVNDVDFQVEVKFESPLKKRIQLQGVLVEQDEDDFLRFNFQHDGTETRIVAASFMTGTPTIEVNEAISVTTPMYMRVMRMGDTWSISYSADGATWTTNGLLTITHKLAVSKVGFFVGNAGREPAHTGIVDYFFNTASPIVPEDPIVRTLPLNIVGEGRVDNTCGNPIILTAKPNLGWTFGGWSGSLSGMTNPANMTLTGGEVVTATFVPKPFGLNITVSGGGEVVSDPGQEYFDNSDVVALRTVPAPGWVFVGWGGDLNGSASPTTLTMTNSKSVVAFFDLLDDSSGIQSDDFNRCQLDTSPWEYVDPVGDAILTFNGEQAQIFLPTGSNHDIWTDGNRAPRLLQPIANTDFQIEAKFDSPMQKRFQIQGILVEEDDANLIRFNFQHDGTDLRIFAATFISSTPTVRINQIISDAAPLYMRILRAGDSWSLLYSTDGITWQTDSAFHFTHKLSAQKSGVFVGNSGANPIFTGLIDYFFNAVSSITNEDSDVLTIDVQIEGSGTVTKTPDATVYDCGNVVELRATPNANFAFAGWSGDITGTDNPLIVTVDSDKTIKAIFKPLVTLSIEQSGSGTVSSTPHQGPFIQGETITITAEPQTGWVFKEWSGDVAGTENPLTVMMDNSKTIIAIFEKEAVQPPSKLEVFLPLVRH